MQLVNFGVVLVALAVGAAVWAWRNIATKIIYDYQKGLLYRNGAFVKLLNSGSYRYIASSSRIDTVDCRKMPFTLADQEILTKDLVNVRITLVGNYQVTDPVKAVHDTVSHVADLYTLAQLALRNCVGEVTLDQLLEKKSDLDAKLLEKMSGATKDLGVTMVALTMRDVMLPASLKRAFAGALEAQKDAQRQLEVAVASKPCSAVLSTPPSSMKAILHCFRPVSFKPYQTEIIRLSLVRMTRCW